MINELNRVVLMGHLGADAKQHGPKGPVTFSVATTARWTDADNTPRTRTEWHNAVAFGGLSNYAVKLKKGDRVYIEGELRSSRYEKQIGTETVAFVNFEIAVSQLDRVAAKADNED